MTNEEIRIKVAESLGWHEKPEPVGSANATAWWKGEDRYPSYLMPVPNYPESLDACAEFERVLSAGLGADLLAYPNHILEVVREGDCTELARAASAQKGCFLHITATPRQRCLAYLKTKGILYAFKGQPLKKP